MKVIWWITSLAMLVCALIVHSESEREVYIDGYIIRMSYKAPRVITKSIVTTVGKTLVVNSLSNYIDDKYILLVEELNGRKVTIMVSEEEYNMYKENSKVQHLFKNKNVKEVE